MQTLQQLKDVYGDSVDKIVQGNTSNIVFLKSTDDSMIETLSKMSGTRHVTRRESKTISQDANKLMNRNEAKISYTMSTVEEPVISYNDLAYISERQSILFRAGNSVIWNRNETILPMSFRLFENTLIHPGHEYSLQTIPTLSTAMEFDIRTNQPNFTQMLADRMAQAIRAEDAMTAYKNAYGYNDDDVSRLDQDVLSDEVMGLIDSMNWKHFGDGMSEDEIEIDEIREAHIQNQMGVDEYDVDPEALAEAEAALENSKTASEKIYLGKTLSRDDLISASGQVGHGLDSDVARAYKKCRLDMERDMNHFSERGGDLYGVGKFADRLFIKIGNTSADIDAINQNERAMGDSDYDPDDVVGTVSVTDDFYRFLVSLDSWSSIAGGEFEREMIRLMDAR